MRIRNIITLLLLPLLATACNTDKGDAEGIVPTPVELVIRASQGVTTRASVVEDPEIVVGADLAATAASTETTTSPDTRTELGPVTGNEQQISGNEQQIYWSGPVESDVPGEDKPGDQIMVWATPNSTNTVGYAFEQTVFSLAHFNYTYSSADFTAVVANTMDEDYTYTYHAIYPSPRIRKLSGSSYTESAVDGITMNTDGTVTYSLPTTQTGDYNGAYDIMRGTATGAALNDSSDADNSIWPQPELRMQHLMHLMRIRVPENRNLMGRSIKRLEITFPQAIVGGTVTFNPTDPSVTPFWSGQSTKVTIDFDDTNLLDAAGRDVWIFVKPETISGVISFQAYDTAGVPAAAISTTVNKTLHSQHITPIALTIPSSLYPVTYLKITETENNLGEAWNTMTLSNATFVNPFTLETTDSLGVTSNTAKVYEVAIAAEPSTMQGKSIVLRYESEHTLFDDPLSLPSNIRGNSVSVNKVVPYLLEEDFSGITKAFESYSNYTDSDALERDAISLTQYGLNDWYGARVGGGVGKNIRIASRVETGMWLVNRNTGRVDTPTLSRLKSGANATIKVAYNYAGDRYEAVGSGGFPVYSAGTSTSVVASGNDAINNIVVSGVVLAIDGPGKNATYYGSTPHYHSFNASGCANSTRISWSLTNNRAAAFAGNGMYYLYLDNIKVSIAQ